MLEPDRRLLLLDALRPPPGMSLESAVGTTFSLDLEALLLAPIAFALFDARLAETGDPERTDPLAVMEAVRRHASRIDMFCQAGQIKMPPRDKPVLSLLEDSVHPSSAPSVRHIFHPKVWCLRFKSSDSDDSAFRLLVLSRNLTFDRSWDTIVSVDGSPTGPHPDLEAMNRPLADFVRSLPELANRPLPQDRIERIRRLADDLRNVTWELPDGFDDLAFLPAGLDDYEAEIPESSSRVLVISPFLTSSQLSRIAGAARKASLVSRPESLDLIHMDILDQFEEVFVLADTSFDSEDNPHQAQQTPPTTEETGERPGVNLAGIHAKVWVSENGHKAELRTGSTNATNAGWNGNVEFDIALTGRKKHCGVEATLHGGQKETSLFDLLVRYHRSERPALQRSEAEEAAYRLEQLGREIARLALLVRVEEDGDGYRMILSSDRPLPSSSDVSVTCWPVSRPFETGTELRPNESVHVSIGGLSLQGLTSFFAFQLETTSETGPVIIRIVNNARMTGQPEDRAERLLLEQLKTRGDVLRYLLFLLADIGDDSAYEFASLFSSASEGTSGRAFQTQIPLFETMVRALSRHPEALTPIHSLIIDLQRTEKGSALLPDGLDQIWPVIWEARSRLP